MKWPLYTDKMRRESGQAVANSVQGIKGALCFSAHSSRAQHLGRRCLGYCALLCTAHSANSQGCHSSALRKYSSPLPGSVAQAWSRFVSGASAIIGLPQHT
jgi:hypothetical protein